ncbi:HEPN domain-containing protein [Maribacter sp. ACAM166]|uniref:HEPN domain-containing protein n=1 Tax=Maribacter sp. ACAM166 TaxID=2508996 RepID=UPI0010FE4BC4|nr:HEPN domain-containing protein [Maribacter sp. ACAM166]TLP74153.1 hypothetical protein ES765_16585 [Maribacter sp. ACAM166]
MFNNSELNIQYNRIQQLIVKAKEFEPDDELRSHLTKYICVLCSGFIENSVFHAFSDIAENSCDSSVVLTYAKSQLFKIQNANSEKIRALAKSFNPEWHDVIRDYMQEENRGAAINYILKDRHNIAHGRDSDITIIKLEDYLNKTVEVIQYIENELNANEASA